MRIGRHEHPELPRNDLVEEAIGGEALAHRVGEARQFDAPGAHDAAAAKLETLGQVEDGPAVQQRREGLLRRQRCDARRRGVGGPGRRDAAADDALALVGLQPIDARRLVRQPLPDRQQQAGDHVQIVLSENSGTSASSAVQAAAKASRSASTQRVSPMASQRHVLAFHRPDQADAPLDLAIVEHDAGGRDLHGGAAGLLVDEQDGARIAEMIERRIERDRPIALALGDGQQPGFGAGARMGVDHLPVGDDEALGPQRLQPDIIGARGDRALDPRREQLLEGAEQHALQLDGQRQQPVEEGGDRRQLVLDAIGVHQLQAGRRLEALERAAFDLAAHDQQIELAQRVAGIVAFQIVLGPEQALAAGLALAAGDGAQRVEPPRDRREEALLGLHIGRDRPEQRRLRLVGAMGAAEALDGGVGLPARPRADSGRAAAVPGREFGVIAAPRAAGVREHQDALLVVHEGLRLGEVGRAGAVLDDQARRPCARCGASGR